MEAPEDPAEAAITTAMVVWHRALALVPEKYGLLSIFLTFRVNCISL